MPETLMIKTQKELVYSKMEKLIEKTGLNLTGKSFKELLAVLKVEDARLNEVGYTECHFSRYQLVKVIEEAEGIV